MTYPKRPIEEAWKKYAEMFISPEAGEEQRDEMKGCFYAGAHTFNKLLIGGLSKDVGTGDGLVDIEKLAIMQVDIEKFVGEQLGN